jgi:hypothetical protein
MSEIRRFGQQFGDGAAIELAVGLRARPAHRSTLAAVQNAELNPSAVDRPTHDGVERIDLAHRCPLPSPPIAGLHDISPIVVRLCVSSSVRAPTRAAAASHPACPPPTTTTSHDAKVSFMGGECMERAVGCRGFT